MTASSWRGRATRPRCTAPAGRPAGWSRTPASRSPPGSGRSRREVVFTCGGTEADNLAVKGAYWSARRATRTAAASWSARSSTTPCVDAALWLAQTQGARGRAARRRPARPLDLDRVRGCALEPSTAVVSVMWANNEVGTVQPVGRVAEPRPRAAGALVHSDAVQAVGHVPVDFAASGLDLLSLTAHKLGGPVGIGALLARRGARADPGPARRRAGAGRPLGDARRRGASPVSRRRSRSPSTPREAEDVRLRGLRDGAVRPASARSFRTRSAQHPGRRRRRLPGVLSLAFPGCEADAMLMLLDAAGIDCATGSACSAGVAAAEPRARGDGPDRAGGPQHAAVLARPHQQPRPTSRRWSPPCRRRSTAGDDWPARSPAARVG